MYVHECTYVGFELMLCFEYVCTVAYIGTSYVRTEGQVKTSLFFGGSCRHQAAQQQRPTNRILRFTTLRLSDFESRKLADLPAAI